MKKTILVFILLIMMMGAAVASVTTEAVVVGTGKDKLEALQDAFATAVQQLNGTYIGVIERLGEKQETKEVVSIGLANLKRYKIVDEKQSNGLVTLTVRVLMEKQETLKSQVADGFKQTISIDKALDIAAFQQAGMKNTVQLLKTMTAADTLLAIGYQFSAAGAPVVEDVGAEYITGYLPVWVGRNSTFWLELADILKSIEPSEATDVYGWYSGPFDSELWTSAGARALPFDLEGYRLADNALGVRINKELSEVFKPLVVKISLPGSTTLFPMYFDKNLIVAGFDASSPECSWLISNRKIASPWFLAPGWTEVAHSNFVSSAPAGAPIYIAPSSKPYSEDLLTTEFQNYVHIYNDSQKTERTGADLSAFRSTFYHRWGLSKPVATTGLGFTVKIPFKFKNALDLKRATEKLHISVDQGISFAVGI